MADPSLFNPLPYDANPSRQKQGRTTEERIIKGLDMRLHPNSGAGHIKHDGSSESELVEIKDANLTYTISAKELKELFTRAVRQGKDARFIISFANGLVIDGHVGRGIQPPPTIRG